MGSDSEQITCRTCKEPIYVSEDDCPHCGADLRSGLWPLAAVVFGLFLAGGSALNPGDLLAYGILGILIAATGGYLYYEKRSRMGAATKFLPPCLVRSERCSPMC